MTPPVPRIARKLHSTKFGAEYPRHIRSNDVSPADEVDPEAARFTEVPADYQLVFAQPPNPNWIRSLELHAQEFLTHFNQPLIYRTLKLLYGPPDVVTALVSEGGSAALVDWSFTLTLDASTLCEVRSKHYSRVHLVFWTPPVQSAEGRAPLTEVALSFCSALDNFLGQNSHIWDEPSDLAVEGASTAIVNVANEKYQSAEQLLTAAVSLDLRPEARPIPPGEGPPVVPVGYLYAAAATQFFVAVEALVNLLYTLLLRPDFRNRTYERLTVRSEIDLRLVSMHVFCTGFSRQPLVPGTDLWQRVVDLRDFRNDLLHGNITEEHRIHSFTEDHFLFFYTPSADFRGRKLEARSTRALPRAQTQITRRVVESVKATVDELRSELIAAMNDDTKTWAKSWLHAPFIPPRNQ